MSSLVSFSAAAVVLAMVAPVLDVGFLADDWLLLTRVHQDQASGVPWSEIWAPSFTDRHQLFRPVTLLLMHGQLAAFGPSPRAFHGVSLALWLIACLQCGHIAATMIETRSRVWQAAGVLTFGAWPACVEALGWVAAQGDLLCLVFSLGALQTVLRRRPVATAVLVALATLSKETAVVLPIVLLVTTWGLGRRAGPLVHMAGFGAAGACVGLRLLRFGTLDSSYRDRGFLELLAEEGPGGWIAKLGESVYRLVAPVSDAGWTSFASGPSWIGHAISVVVFASCIVLLFGARGRGALRPCLLAATWVILPLSLALVPLDGVAGGLERSRLLVLPCVGHAMLVLIALHAGCSGVRRTFTTTLGAVAILLGAVLWRADLAPYLEATRRIDHLTASIRQAPFVGTPQNLAAPRRVILLGTGGDGPEMRPELLAIPGSHVLAAGLHHVAQPPFVDAPGLGLDLPKDGDLKALAAPSGSGERPAVLRFEPAATPPRFDALATGGSDVVLTHSPKHGATWSPPDDAAFTVSGDLPRDLEADTVRAVLAEPLTGDRAIAELHWRSPDDGHLRLTVPVTAFRAQTPGRPSLTADALRAAPGGLVVWWVEILSGDKLVAYGGYNGVLIKP